MASVKVFALGRRYKWKDYVDLYFILKDHFATAQIVEASDKICGQLFSGKLFGAQLSFFDDIDYAEEIEHMTKTTL